MVAILSGRDRYLQNDGEHDREPGYTLQMWEPKESLRSAICTQRVEQDAEAAVQHLL